MTKEANSPLRDNIVSIVAVLTLFVAILGIFWYLTEKLSTQGERLAKLEERVSICAPCEANVPIERDKGGYKWTQYKSKEKDDNGKISFEVDIDVLDDKYRWECGKFISEDITKKRWLIDGKERLEEIIRKYDPKIELADAKSIVVVGTASTEGDQLSQSTLAEKRARTLLKIVADNLTAEVPIIGMNFGQFVGDGTNVKCSDDTSEQRRIVIVKVIKQPDGISDAQLEQSLVKRFEELAKGGSFPIDIRNYSNYQNKRVMFIKK